MDLKSLVSDLKAGEHTERESFQYAVGVFLLGCLNGVQGAAGSSGGPSVAKIIGALIGVLIGAVIGYLILSYFYKCNCGDSGKNFLHRTLALHFVVSSRVSIVFFPLVVAVVIPVKFFPQIISSGAVYSGVGLIIVSGIVAFIYWLSTVGNSLREISGNKN